MNLTVMHSTRQMMKFFKIDWSKIDFTTRMGCYTATFRKTDQYFEYYVELWIENQITNNQRLSLTQGKKRKIMVTQKGNDINLNAEIPMKLSNKEYITTVQNDNLRFHFRAKPLPLSNVSSEDYDKILKRVKRNTEKRNKKLVTPIKVYLGGGVTPK